jgi:hypothetical protein
MAVHVRAMRQKNKTNFIILNPMLLSLSTVQLRTRVSMGGQLVAKKRVWAVE